MLDGETLALLGLGYRLCFYAELYCPADGILRIALEYEPGSRLPCPLCNRSCAAGFLFCRGFTRKKLPFHELVAGPLTVNHRLPAADEPRPPKPPALAENEQHALEALVAGEPLSAVCETYAVRSSRLYYLRRKHGLPIRHQHHAAR